LINEKIFNNNHRNIEFYSDLESFSLFDKNLSTILINKKVKIFKQSNLLLIKSKYGKGNL
jgi:hypothetical protein